MTATQRLAIHGGDPVFPEGPPAWPLPDEAVRAALQAAWADGSWGRYEGPHVERLAARLAAMHGVPHVYCCSSGTAGVELALRGLKVGLGDEVVLAGYDFRGNLRALEVLGAQPVLVDVEPGTWCISPAALPAAFGPRVKAILVSHLHGHAAAMPRICEWATACGVAVVEDACQFPGATVAGRPAGSWGDAGVLSFGGSKLLTAGRGGAVLTRRADVYQRIKVHCERGNHACPLSELQAAVLLPQLEQLAARNRRRGGNAARLRALCAAVAGLDPGVSETECDVPAWYKVPWLYDAEQSGRHSRDEFLAALQAEGVDVGAGFRGFVRASRQRCRSVGQLAGSRQAADATILLHHPVLLESAETVARVAAAIRKVADAFRAIAVSTRS